MKKLIVILALISMFAIGCTKSPVAMQENVSSEETQVNSSEVKLDEEKQLEDDNAVSGVELKGILTKDVYGNEVDENLFKGNKITVLNLWGTFCGPCIDEMPDLEKISKEYKEQNVKVVGIVIDDPTPEDAVSMLKELGVTYTNIYPDDKLKEIVTSKFDYVPVTLFVDSQGKILKTFIPGSEDKDAFKKIIDKLIKEN